MKIKAIMEMLPYPKLTEQMDFNNENPGRYSSLLINKESFKKMQIS
jgi:hypothetical protein